MFERMETELKEHTKSLEALKFNRSELIELRHVLEKTEIFFLEVIISIQAYKLASLITQSKGSGVNLLQ